MTNPSAPESEDLLTYYEAALAQPGDPTARAALGCALARAGRFTDAVQRQ